MIIDKLENIRFYAGLLPNLENGLKALEKLPKDPQVGRYEFEGGYFMVQKGTTAPMEGGDFEAHRKYIDLQILLKGSEEMAWANLRDLTVTVPYSGEKDAEMLKGNFDHVMKLTAGMCYALFPEDAHRPSTHTKEAQEFTKIVMKLPVA